MFVISENSIIDAAVRFLREYYKTRNQLAWEWKPLEGIEEDGGDFEEAQFEAALEELKIDLRTVVRKNVMSEDGIVVDAMMTFYEQNNQPFNVALEATSYHKKQEATFVAQPKLLTLDSLAIATIVITILYGTFFYFEGSVAYRLGIWTTILLLWVIFFGLFFAIRYMLTPLSRRYRYIFSVEQFKRYFAHEQWIALGTDVFESENTEVFQELKRQCVDNGLGLILVNKELQTHLVFSPSRVDINKNKKSILRFLPLGQAQQLAMQKQMTRGKDALRRAANPLIKSVPDYDRFQRNYYSQYMIIGIFILILGTLLTYEFNNPPVRYVDEDKYREEMEEFAENTSSETHEFYLDTNAYMPLIDVEHSYLDLARLNSPNFNSDLYELRRRGDHVEIFVKTSRQTWILYDCGRFMYKQDLYCVSPGSYSSVEEAVEVIRRLKTWGIPASFFWRGCFDDNDRSYQVMIRYFFDDRQEADYLLKQLQQYQVKLDIRGVGFKVLEVRAF